MRSTGRAIWAAASASRWSRPARSGPTPGTLFGPVPWVLWDGLVGDEVDDKRRLLQALNCLLIETPSGRVLVETGIGERRRRQDPRDAGLRRAVDRAGARDRRLPARVRRRRGDEPPPLRPCRRPAAGGRRARIPAREDRRPAGRVGGRARRQPAARRVATSSRSCGSSRLGQAGLGRRRARDHAGRDGRPDRRPLERPPGGRRPGWRRRRTDRWPSSATC